MDGIVSVAHEMNVEFRATPNHRINDNVHLVNLCNTAAAVCLTVRIDRARAIKLRSL